MMMKKVLLKFTIVLAVLIVPVFSLSCSSDTIKVSPGNEFTLPIGKTATINGENLLITFEKVSADSRCPTGVECIQAGSANCDMLFNYKGLDYTVTLKAGSGNDNVVFTDYTIEYALQPYPVYGSTLDPEKYNLKMTVTK
jgi:hypothetical protein